MRQGSLGVREFKALVEQPVRVEDLVHELQPPKHFAEARFDNYKPDPAFPSQAGAVAKLEEFLEGLKAGRSIFARLLSRRAQQGSGIYLDGGFGIGKTHLLASAYHAFGGVKAYLTFQELMFLVGLQGLPKTVETFAKHALLIIDEFELDDPANTRISTNLLGQLFSRGVSIISSSNTPPGALGEGKFSVEAFQRELGKLFSRFISMRIDGEDYRISHGKQSSGQSSWIVTNDPSFSLSVGLPASRELAIDFLDLLSTLALAHPIRVRKSLHGVEAISVRQVVAISDPHAALRFVYLIDKAYDDNISFAASSEVEIQQLFASSIYHGGDTKKYLRAMSRLEEMTMADASWL